MAEPTLTEIMNAIVDLSTRLGLIANAVDDARANLAQHRRDIELRTTQMDIAMRDEIAVVRANVTAVDTKVDGINTQQIATDQTVASLSLKLDTVGTKQDTVQIDVDVIAPKIEEVKTKQIFTEQALLDLSLKLDDIDAKLSSTTP